jgi:hypothetical protein
VHFDEPLDAWAACLFFSTSGLARALSAMTIIIGLLGAISISVLSPLPMTGVGKPFSLPEPTGR